MTTRSHISAQQKILDLENRLKEAEDTLDAIRRGSVDALVVKGKKAREIFTLQSADYTYRMLIESMNQGALAINLDGTILYSNKQFSTMLKTPLEHIIGNDILPYVSGEDRPVIQALLQNIDQVDTKLEISLLPLRASKLTVIASVTTVYQEGVSPYLCIVVTDMTERKQAEDAKDEFISLASHQLRTPATSVKQYINMLIDGMFGELNDAQAAALHKANDGNERELKIIEDLLKVAQIDAGKIALNRRYTDIDGLLKEVIAEQSVRLKERQQALRYDAPPGPVVAHIDSGLVRMVIENLLDNASKYMEAGTITVACRLEPGQATFSITDEGVGMSKKDITKLFQKFSRLPNSLSVKVGGSGLGLYWAKKVVDLHEADIAVSSAIGKGTTFTVSLPRGEDFAQNISR